MSDKTQEEMYEDFQDGKFEESGYLLNNRQTIEEHTGLKVPNSMVQLPDWYDRMKSTISRKLNPDNTDDGDDSDEEVEDTEEQSVENDENDKAQDKEE